ncbi:MAG TPA: hypothetical protein PKL15_12650, partial [Saprospiraceae bacterium]|nr:hypothetical protein [Saprospiraceae bacterium]
MFILSKRNKSRLLDTFGPDFPLHLVQIQDRLFHGQEKTHRPARQICRFAVRSPSAGSHCAGGCKRPFTDW